MKIMVSKIKGWNFKKRLEEIDTRLQEIFDWNPDVPMYVDEKLQEISQIVKYWRDHVKDEEEKPKKSRTKSVNIYD